MALNLTAGYSAVYPGENNFSAALLGAAAALKASADAGSSPTLALVYADEELIPQYKGLEKEPIPALAFAALLGAAETGAVTADTPENSPGMALPWDCESPHAFLRALAEGMAPTANRGNTANLGGAG
jgi:hypothetical protein